MKTSNKFKITDIVTLKSHPMYSSARIRGDSRYVPPIMLIKEIHFEPKEKKIVDEASGKKIADKIKYLCVYFDDNKGEFCENFFYESLIETIDNLLYERINNQGTNFADYTTLKEEVKSYPNPIYEYGKEVYFKTLKLEIYKKRSSKKYVSKKDDDKIDVIETVQYVVNNATPKFVFCGYKKEYCSDKFYPNGNRKKRTHSEFVKVKWFSPFQQKFSEQYLPISFFTDEDIFEDKLKSKPKPIRKFKANNPAKDNKDIRSFDEGQN